MIRPREESKMFFFLCVCVCVYVRLFLGNVNKVVDYFPSFPSPKTCCAKLGGMFSLIEGVCVANVFSCTIF